VQKTKSLNVKDAHAQKSQDSQLECFMSSDFDKQMNAEQRNAAQNALQINKQQ